MADVTSNPTTPKARYLIIPDTKGDVEVHIPVHRNFAVIISLVLAGVAIGYGLIFLGLSVLHSSSAIAIPIVIGVLIAAFTLSSVFWLVFGTEILIVANVEGTITYRWQALCIRQSRVFEVSRMGPLQKVPAMSGMQVSYPTFGFLYDGQMFRLGHALDRRAAREFLLDVAQYLPEAVRPFQLQPTKIQDQIATMEARRSLRRDSTLKKTEQAIEVVVSETVSPRAYFC
ncbi:hypothetical protein Ae201684P_000298 [Aphanomyces euteiches]|uniref:Uncharacterized protein n=1 Tax=Aphanomyces euteiches TaxID=100861 RepID=A0A6G0XR60_9STRA|nr:hypothetical protein Ae201684_002093 [Aphanomyces euteiches]KAH9086882.1 hypothetical protein Ae201684P_000298 [Aphanomyces euteiches]KAH9132607.1 hypothetical protein AeRB84_021044 [Aphanomyces euteiches]KAH9145236.1 hypothetical protein AeRB84_010869 [Aphanomyces euteiches]KAH9147683.1 hypothetical protein AeRB84_008747 [Aphanomyces euteiches]